jgi:hypothetical protein
MTSFNSPFSGTTIQPTDVSYRAFTITADTQLQWPINGNATDDYSARIMEVTASTAGLELWMPPANQTSVGNDALIRNVGVETFVVKDYAGVGTIISIAAGEAKYIYVTDNPDEEGTWGIISFGTGTSSADAATLAGYGLIASGLTLNQSSPVTLFSNDRTAVDTDRASLLAWIGGAGTLTLDVAATLGNNWFVQVRNSGTGLLTIDCSASDTINDSNSIGLQPSDSCFIACSGSEFFTVGLGKNTQFNFSQLVKTVSSGTYTLTSSEASNVIQKYVSVGDLTADVTIIVPPTIQVYYVQNATSGSASNYTVTLSTGVSGGADATISAGEQSTLICDSVNLVNANTLQAGNTSVSLSDGTVGAPSLKFGSEASTGIYRSGAGELSVSILGTNVLTIESTGIDVAGSGNFTGGVSGGTFT